MSDTNPYRPPAALGGDVIPQQFAVGHWPITAEVFLDAKTHIRAHLLHSGWTLPATRIVCCLAGVAMLVGCLATPRETLSDAIGIVGLLLVLWSMFARYAIGVGVRARLQQAGWQPEVVRYEITPDVLRMQADGEDIRLAWRLFHKFKDDGQLLLAYRGAKWFVTIPLAAFDTHDQETIRQLLTGRFQSPDLPIDGIDRGRSKGETLT